MQLQARTNIWPVLSLSVSGTHINDKYDVYCFTIIILDEEKTTTTKLFLRGVSVFF